MGFLIDRDYFTIFKYNKKLKVMRLNLDTIKKIETEFGEFDISQVIGGSNDVYLRFGYWSLINASKLQEIVGSSIKVVEDSIYDDDCGELFSYKLKNPF